MKCFCAFCLQPYEKTHNGQEFCTPKCCDAYNLEEQRYWAEQRRRLRENPPPKTQQHPNLGLSDGSDRDPTLHNHKD